MRFPKVLTLLDKDKKLKEKNSTLPAELLISLFSSTNSSPVPSARQDSALLGAFELRLEMCGVAMVIAVNKGYPWWNLFGPMTHTQSWNNRLCKWLLLCK